jgi:hypothetical protein
MAIIPAEEKVFMVSNSTNTTYSGSAALKAMQQWYTMEDVTNTVRPYQVFTALLTQSGGSDELFILSGAVTEGVTYLIASGASNSDFSNVGGPVIGTNDYYFIATNSDIPNNYGGARLYYNTGAPVATVLENTIGNVWFTYDDIGIYLANLTGAFTINKTFVTLTLGGGAICILNSQRGTDDYVVINANDAAAPNNPIDVGGVMQIEIRVYN